MNKKGFTLIELLLVIGILAILSAVVVLVLNPAQLFAQARDSQRMGDLAATRDAVIFYTGTASTITFGTQSRATANVTCGLGSGTCDVVNASTTVNGGGWVGVDLTGATGGSPLARLPLDPTNNANYQYAYDGDNDNGTFELNARLESDKYYDKMVSDGGNKNTCTTATDPDYTDTTCYYEVGTDPDLDL